MIESSTKSITILSDVFDMDPILQVMLFRSSWQNSPLLDTPKDNLVCINKTFFYEDLEQLGSVVDCLKKFLASKGFRNTLKWLDYNTMSMQRK